VNGVECEPYLTTDHRVMLEQGPDIFSGVRYLQKATGAPRVVIAVEANKLDAAEALRAAVPEGAPIEVAVVEVKYPQGAEKMLITALLGREVPSGGLPIDVHALCVNVATAAEIGRFFAEPRNRDLLSRLRAAGVRARPERRAEGPAGGPLVGKTVVITGTLPGRTRAEAKAAVEALGGRVASSVSRKTDLVVYGEAPGSKLDRARDLGVETLDAEGFEALAGSRINRLE